MSANKYTIRWIAGILLFPWALWAQTTPDSLSSSVSLDECIHYALRNQPVFRQSVIDQQINERTIRSNLAAWMPQIRAEYNLLHYFAVPFFFLTNAADPNGPKQAIRAGYPNQSTILFQADQVLYSNDVLLAAKAARYSRQQFSQNIDSSRINVIVNVSKAFYDVLVTQQQSAVLDEDIVRLQRQLNDAYQLYQGGLTDKVDYKRATIALNNSRSQRKTNLEALKYKYATLKQLIGAPAEKDLAVTFDTTRMQQEVLLDTLQLLSYENRVEYQLLKTRQQLQTLNVKYYQRGFLPTVSAFVNYNPVFQNYTFSDLYARNYYSSQVGLRAVLPLFTGTRRIQNIQQSKLQLQRLDLTLLNTKNVINTQYQQALALYKSNLNDWKTQNENLQIAREVYNTLNLQYKEGIKTYLEVITSEADLRTAQLNYLNALFNVLTSKLDVQKALGTVNINQ